MKKLWIVFLILPSLGWGQFSPAISSQIRAHFERGDLVAIGSVPSSDWDRYGSMTPQADYARLVAGDYHDKVFEIDCRLFYSEGPSNGTYRYWVYGTDETGFGWSEGQPMILTTARPLESADPFGLIDAVALPVGVEEDLMFDQETGNPQRFAVPVFKVLFDQTTP